MIRKDSESWETQIRKLGSVRRAVTDIHNGLPIRVTQEDSDSWTGLAAARQAQELQERKQQSKANQTRRFVKHPAFKAFGSKDAENYLALLQHGDAIICPSSKGADHLAVTWKVADGVYQHIGEHVTFIIRRCPN